MKQILCFGDSNTWGLIPKTSERFPWGIRWTSILSEKLGQGKYHVVEEGLCGRTTVFDDPLRDGRCGVKALPTLLESHDPIDLSIPPIVYIPYGIALLPTFRSVSIFVIFLASFWPIFAGTMSGVLNVDKKIVDSAKVLNVKKSAMLTSVVLPASLPQIFLGCNQGLSVSFILLTSAEMIGARDGMGYYVKY